MATYNDKLVVTKVNKASIKVYDPEKVKHHCSTCECKPNDFTIDGKDMKNVHATKEV